MSAATAALRVAHLNDTPQGTPRKTPPRQPSAKPLAGTTAYYIRSAKRHAQHEANHGVTVKTPRPTGLWRYQDDVRACYSSSRVQWFVAGLIVANFVSNLVEKEIDPRGDQYPPPPSGWGVWRTIELVFNALFAIELAVNMYGSWFWLFWISSWNVFDTIVVSVGIASSAGLLNQVPSLRLLRVLRAFRVFRLFKRIKSLNRILSMIVSAIPGVSSAFLVLIVSISIYALVGVEFYHTFGVGLPPALTNRSGSAGGALLGSYESYLSDSLPCEYTNADGGVVGARTGRDMCYGDEYFGSFFRAWFTLFQVLTGESWAEAIARPILFGWEEYGSMSVLLGSLYWLTFTFANTFILFNVFVAVLLDKMMAADQPKPTDDDDEDEDEADEHTATSALSPKSGGSRDTLRGADGMVDVHADEPISLSIDDVDVPAAAGRRARASTSDGRRISLQLEAVAAQQRELSASQQAMAELMRSLVDRMDTFDRRLSTLGAPHDQATIVSPARFDRHALRSRAMLPVELPSPDNRMA